MMDLITEHIATWTGAEIPKANGGRGRGRGSNGQSPHGIKKLRELIFELAAKGLLVDNSLKSPEHITTIGEIAALVMGQAPPGNECNKDGIGTVFVKTGEFGELYPEIVEWTTKPLKFAQEGDVLICVVGATVGKLNLAINCAIGRSVAAIRPSRKVDTKFLYFSLMPYTLKLRNQSRGSAQGVIGKAELNAVKILLPPLAEQHRIVAKVDELMALCDKLEQQQTDSNDTHQTLVETLLATLTTVADPTEFALSWQRIMGHFDTLFTTEESIDQLKQAILQLAVMGKLVPQNPNDEPASTLLEKIAKEKAKLIKEGKIKKQKTLPKISEDEKPFDLPVGWGWVRLDDLALRSEAGWSPNCEPTPRKDNDWGVLKVSAVSWGQYNPDENKALPANLRPRPEFEVFPDDFLISRANTSELVARAVIVPKETPPRLMMSDKIIRFVFSRSSNTQFVNLANGSSSSREYYSRVAGGTSSSMKNVSRDQIRMLLIALPPLAEQHRIVAKVDELLALCDTLKERLHDAKITQVQLADAIVEQAVA